MICYHCGNDLSSDSYVCKNCGKNNEKIFNEFNRFQQKDFTEDDANNVFGKEEKIKNKAKEGPLKDFSEYIALFFEMLKDYFSKKYTEVPKGTIASIIFTLLYIFSPFDLVPDFLWPVGLMDDAAVIAVCIKMCKSDIDNYKNWKKEKKKLEKDYAEE